ncbi:uncharacterized protein F5147DRAFT_712271 [Suillus discolor]|uniref:Uncharacterized protein n=1 Tax=Suillus discolor TaxID=1912936 RepID=A0A9P7EZP1_9AGAM|nr:uncharacterized protein F5147DRAFT_712271 [Suillus discolor]KAG2099225.1 hypothetical protein F5147DRAFT_712271 [Suillus discolor]
MSNAKPTTSSLIVLRGSSYSSVSSDKSSGSSDFDKYSSPSSSGQTTPEDDEDKVFQLDVRHIPASESEAKLRPVLRGSLAMKKAATALHSRQRTLSAAVKTVSRAFTVFKKRRSDEEEPVFIASPLRERFGRRISIKTRPEEFYSLPNRYFSVHDLPMQKANTIGHKAERRIASISGPPSSSINRPSRRPRNLSFSLPGFVEELQAAMPLSPPVTAQVPLADSSHEERESSQRILTSILRGVLFVPWCAIVGGALLLFPQELELVVFRPGYLKSLQGIRRFAHWADCAFHHAMIFLAFVVALMWYKAAVGVPVACGLMSRFLYVWTGFQVDSNVPLGWDDQQSLYLLAKGTVFENRTVLIKGCEGEPRIAQLRED